MKQLKKTSKNLASSKKSKAVSLPIVAIGASAGGLEAITQLLQHLPSQTGMAFIYIQHLSPDHKSMLVPILSKSTKMKVEQVTNYVIMEPDHFYVVPPDKMMNLENGHIRLTPRPRSKEGHLPIDTFFSSLAERHGECSVGIILSGSATDGTRGLTAIKEAGGVTFAQDDSAKFKSMPDSAIAAGVVDFVLSPREIALELIELSKHPFVRTNGSNKNQKELIQDGDPAVKAILAQLYRKTGVDFSQYKLNTIKRRIMRRMLLYKIKSPKDYVKLLSSGSNELETLYHDFLINVTSFFRDEDTYRYLKNQLFPKLIRSKKANKSLRIWVPACSTGEETYSIAMLLQEVQNKLSTRISMQIFATDLRKEAIEKARLGIYGGEELKGVSPKRLQNFFVKSNGTYRINKSIREMCVFAPHDVLKDPPFSHIDLISCRNLFIYLDAAAQKRVTAIFNYALNDAGYLLLGKSETLSSSSQLFGDVNKKLKIFAKKRNAVAHIPESYNSPFSRLTSLEEITPKPSNNKSKEPDNLGIAIDAMMLEEFMPPGVVINHQMEILQFRGSTDLFLRHASGKATFNILKMAKSEITLELRSGITKAIKSGARVHKSSIEMKKGSGVRMISFEIIPLDIEWSEPLLLILFKEHDQADTFVYKGNDKASNATAKDKRIKKLEQELDAAHADMVAFIQDQEAFNEELQSASEEVVSSNEELQSVNEELETSKEEIESANEELASTNQELQIRNELLNEAYDFSEAIIATMHEPMLILDKGLRVKSANRAFYKKFNALPQDVEGFYFFDLENRQWDIPSLHDLLEDIISRNKTLQDFEVIHSFPKIGERVILFNANRIIQKSHHEQVLLLAMADITEGRVKAMELKEQEMVKETDQRFHFIADALPQKIWVADQVGNGNYFNRKWSQYTGFSYEKLKNSGWLNTLHPDDLETTRKKLDEAIRSGKDFEVEHRILNTEGNYLWHLTRALVYKDQLQKVVMWVGSTTEIQEQKEQLEQTNRLLEQKINELEKMNKELQSFAYVSSHDLQEPLRKIQTFVLRVLEKEDQNLSETGKDYLQRMQSATKRMQTLIADLLKYSRTTTAEQKFEKTNLKKVVEEVMDELQEVIQEKQATVEIGELCEISVIPFQFRQLIQNLVANALKFAKPKIPLSLTIKGEVGKGSELLPQLSSKENYCHITVADNGIGFEAQFNERIFEVFTKLHGRNEYEGTGIGLAIVKKIVENHQGVIVASGELNKGATFNIYLPMNTSR